MNYIQSVQELYQDRSLYSTPDMFSPPSERLSRVIRFELTRGCSWGRCTFCGGYDGVRYSLKTPEQYKEHVDQVWQRIGNETPLANGLKRIFIGGGNALTVETKELKKAIRYTGEKFVQNTGHGPKRTSMYGRTRDILKKGSHQLADLALGLSYGLDLIYWGVESGSSDVLAYVNKGCRKEDITKAAEEVTSTRVQTSVMIMPGLGGMRFYDQHVKGTAEVLGAIRPQYLTFMGVNPARNGPYARKMQQEQEAGTNRPLTDKELAKQMAEMIKQMPFFESKIGCYPPGVDAVGHNSVKWGSWDVKNEESKDRLVEFIRCSALWV